MISSDFNFTEFPNEFLHSGYIFVYFHFLLLLASAQFLSTADFKQWSKISLGACLQLWGTNILGELIFYYRAQYFFPGFAGTEFLYYYHHRPFMLSPP